MNPCDCCDRRSLHMGICRCDACFCMDCLLCSQHCQCVGPNPLGIETSVEIELPEPPAPSGLEFDEDEYPDADPPTVVTRKHP